MKLIELAKLQDIWETDIADNEIDICFYICYEKEHKENDFPYMYKSIELLLQKVEVEKINGEIVIGKFSKLIKDNEKLFDDFIKNNWVDSMQWVLENKDNGEYEYEIIKDLGNVVNGDYGESVNKKYYQLLKKCK